MSWSFRWLLAFALTQSVEMGVYAQAHARPRPLRERLAIAFAASGISHPVLWFFIVPVLTDDAGLRWWTTVAIGEAFAVLSETALLWAFGVRMPIVWALMANATSFLVGLFLYTHFPEW